MILALRRFGALTMAGVALVMAGPLLAGCSGSQPTGTTDPADTADTGTWPTFGGDAARTGDAADLASPGALSVAWRAPLDGAVYGQPLLIGDLVVTATENDTLYGLDATTGQVRWQTHVGTPVPKSALPCGDIDPLGITGTPVYDPASGQVFAVAETTGGTHTLIGVQATTGTVTVRRPVDPPLGDPVAYLQRTALTLLDGRVYLTYGGNAGDCGDYIGTVISAPTTGNGPLTDYTIPTAKQGGIWTPGGPVADGDHLLVSVGNGESDTAYDGSDSIVALSPGLTRTDLFAPTTWPDDNDNDLDLGSMSPAVVGSYVLADGKRGEMYVTRSDHLGGIGGQVATAQVCTAFGSAAVTGDTAYIPCPDGTRAVRIGPDGAVTVLWRSPVQANGSPVVGNGAVWTTSTKDGRLYALDPANGAVLTQIAVGALPHFPLLSASGHRAYVATLTGVVAVDGV